MTLIIGLTLTTAAVALWRGRQRRAAKAVEGDLRSGLGPTVDLVSVVIGSGGTVHHAVETVAEHGPAAVSSCFGAVLRDADDAMLLADALGRLSAELGHIYHPLIGALVATERDGAPVSVLLQRLADDAEQARRWQVESMARRLPVTMLVPLVTCLLPATIVGTVVPLVLVALRHLQL